MKPLLSLFVPLLFISQSLMSYFCNGDQSIVPARKISSASIHSFLFDVREVAGTLIDLSETDADSAFGVSRYTGFSAPDDSYSCEPGMWSNPLTLQKDNEFAGDWTMNCQVKSSGKGFNGLNKFITTRATHEGTLIDSPSAVKFDGSDATHIALNLPVDGAGGNISVAEDLYFGQKSKTEFFSSHYSRSVQGEGAAIYLKQINNGLIVDKNVDDSYSLKFTSHIVMANPWFVQPKEIFTAAAQNAMNRNCSEQVKELVPLLHENL